MSEGKQKQGGNGDGEHGGGDGSDCDCARKTAIIEEVYGLLKSDDETAVAKILDRLADDVVFLQSVSEKKVPWGGAHFHKPGVIKFFQVFLAHVSVEEFIKLSSTCLGNTVFVLGFYRFRCNKSGKTASGPFAHIVVFDDDCKIALLAAIYDADDIVEACGF